MSQDNAAALKKQAPAACVEQGDHPTKSPARKPGSSNFGEFNFCNNRPWLTLAA
jgi:hypothetical protein